eukprot:5800832-Heterocapsa_arctica.AAC.1
MREMRRADGEAPELVDIIALLPHNADGTAVDVHEAEPQLLDHELLVGLLPAVAVARSLEADTAALVED